LTSLTKSLMKTMMKRVEGLEEEGI